MGGQKMSWFPSAVEVVLDHEGGLVDHPSDPGGVTNFGISLRWAMRAHQDKGDIALDLLDLDGDGDIDADDIRKMSRNDAKHAYKRFFWNPYGYDRIDNQEVACKIFDMSVNMGPGQAAKLAQRAVWAATGVQIRDDGVLGRISFQMINEAEWHSLRAAIRSEMAGFYRSLILRNDALRQRGVDVPDFSVFKKGWLRRAYA
jgi:lysozyme family protein